jgi:hypothetical protein
LKCSVAREHGDFLSWHPTQCPLQFLSEKEEENQLFFLFFLKKERKKERRKKIAYLCISVILVRSIVWRSVDGGDI